MKFLVISDIHFHAYTQFGTTLSNGVNSRLQIVINELLRAAGELISQGGDTMIIAGDVFHSRGALDPEVLNPVRDAFEKIVGMGIKIYIIPGNHDLKSNETVALSSSIQNLTQSDLISEGKVMIINNPSMFKINGVPFGFVPWRSNIKALQKDLKALTHEPDFKDAHVFIHAGIDGVLSGVPAGELTPKSLSDHGFKSVFAGHYHNHADMSAGLPNRVMSIGATTQHNWGDIGTRAGFLILDSDKNEVMFNDTHAPKFIDISGLSEDDVEIETPGNYVRYRGPQATTKQIADTREELRKLGALGVSIEVPRATVAARAAQGATGLTLEESVEKYVESMTDVPPHLNKIEIAKRAAAILNLARSVSEDED